MIVGRVRCEMTMNMASSFGKRGYGSKEREESTVKDGFPPFFPALFLSFLTFFFFLRMKGLVPGYR